MKLNNEQIRKLTIAIAGEYLTDPLPENYQEMSDDDLYQFCEDHAWEPFQYYSGRILFDFIYGAANTMQRFIENELDT